MLVVTYVGPKVGGIIITTPIGAQNKTSIKGKLHFNRSIEMDDGDAKKLIELDPHNFQLGYADVQNVQNVQNVTELQVPKKKRGRPAKCQTQMQS